MSIPYVLKSRIVSLATTGFVVSLFLGLPLASATALDASAITCVTKMAKQARVVAATQNKDVAKCLQLAAKGKVLSAQNCIETDASGNVAVETGKTSTLAGALCESPPAYGFAGAGELNASVVAEERDMTTDIFGDDVDGPVAAAAGVTRGTKCQTGLVRTWGKLGQTASKLYERCQKRGFKDSTNMIDSGDDLEACVNELASDPTGKLSKLAAKVTKVVDSACAGQTFSAIFPGDCVESGFADCVVERVRCRTCRRIALAGDFNADCDTIDDGSANESCDGPGYPVTEPPTDALVVRFTKTNEWVGGYNARLRLINHTAPVTDGWTLEFDLADGIDGSSWGSGVLQSYESGHYIFANVSHAPFLLTRTWTDIEFTAISSGTNEPANCVYNGSPCEFEMDLDGSLPDPTFSPVVDPDPLPNVGLTSWLSEEEFSEIFPCADAAGYGPNGSSCAVCLRNVGGEILPFAPDGQPMFSYRGLLEVMEYIHDKGLTGLLPFVNVGDSVQNRQELAAFFANVTQETGTWDSEDGQNCGLTVWEELACTGSPTGCPNTYGPDMDCSAGTDAYGEPIGAFCCDQTGDSRDCQYWGRGPIQLSWGDNYRDLDNLLGLDNALLHNPYLLTSFDRQFVPPAIADKLPPVRAFPWLAAIAYWMETRDWGGDDYIPSAHRLFHETDQFGACVPAGSSGFAQTINNVNGNQECGTNTNAKMLNRVAQYERISAILGVPVVPGELRCGEQITAEFQMPWQQSTCPIPPLPSSPCYPSPCMHGECADSTGPAVCTCFSGWSGQYCDVAD